MPKMAKKNLFPKSLNHKNNFFLFQKKNLLKSLFYEKYFLKLKINDCSRKYSTEGTTVAKITQKMNLFPNKF